MFSKVHAANRKYTDVIVSIKIPQLLREVKRFLRVIFPVGLTDAPRLRFSLLSAVYAGNCFGFPIHFSKREASCLAYFFTAFRPSGVALYIVTGFRFTKRFFTVR